MRQLQDIFEGLLDSDFDGDGIEAMPKVGQTIIDLWSKVKKHNDIGWRGAWRDNTAISGFPGWIVDYGEFLNTMDTTYKTLGKIRKNGVDKKYARTLVRTGDGNPDADVCIICLSGHPDSNLKTLGICRPSTREGLFFETLCDRSRKPCGFIWDSSQQGTRHVDMIFKSMEGSINYRVWCKYWVIPEYCFDVITRKILK